jgi:hypothetical protein
MNRPDDESTPHEKQPMLRLTVALQKILAETDKGEGGKTLTLGLIVESTGERSFAVLLAFLCIPFLTPIPLPGLSTPFGIAVFLLGLQVAIRKHRPWLPRKLMEWKIPPKFGTRLIAFIARIFRPLERIIWPRFGFMVNPGAMALVGIALSLDGLLLSVPSPIPLSNVIPAWIALIKILGISEEDGISLLGGTVLTFVLVAALVAGIALGGFHLMNR